MIKFLIQRPIAVLMAFTACFIIGLVTYSTLPISLLPNIAIPEITIQVSAANTSARELENTIVKPLRAGVCCQYICPRTGKYDCETFAQPVDTGFYIERYSQ